MENIQIIANNYENIHKYKQFEELYFDMKCHNYNLYGFLRHNYWLGKTNIHSSL